MAKTYDDKSYALAEHFLSDEAELFTMDHCHHLACAIQTAIEDYIADANQKHRAKYSPIPTYLCPQCKQVSVAERDAACDPVCGRC